MIPVVSRRPCLSWIGLPPNHVTPVVFNGETFTRNRLLGSILSVSREAIAMRLYGNFHSPVLSLVSTMLAVALCLGAVAVLAGSAFAAERVIYNFTGGNDGIGSNDLIVDRAGNLY